MRSLLSATALVAALALQAGCRPPAGEAAPPPHAAYRGPLASSLQVEAMGDSARLVLQVTNPTEAPIALTFSSSQVYDFAVLQGPTTVWRWAADRSFLQAIQTETLAPGETRTYTETYRLGPDLRGATLTAVGWLTSTDHELEHRTQFRLP